jgi:SOS-response transcriptional repressor LexA
VEHLERGLVAADAEHDEIVVALIDRSEATLKRITQRPEQSILTQLHSTMEPLGYPP